MGVQGARGAGNGKVQSHTAYYVAIGGVLVLLLLVCCYFLYFCLRRVKELAHQEFREVHSVRPPPPPPISPTAYPVQPGVRDSATAMARLCRSLPQDAVFPTSPASPARGVSAFSPTSSVLLPTSPNRLPMSPTSPSRRTFAYYTSPTRRPLSPTSPNRRSLGCYTSPRLPLSPTSPNRRDPASPTRRAATVPARRGRSPHKPPVIVLSPATQTATPLPVPTVIPMR